MTSHEDHSNQHGTQINAILNQMFTVVGDG